MHGCAERGCANKILGKMLMCINLHVNYTGTGRTPHTVLEMLTADCTTHCTQRDRIGLMCTKILEQRYLDIQISHERVS